MDEGKRWGGYPDAIYLPPSQYDALKDLLDDKIPHNFKSGDWAFDGSDLFQILGNAGPGGRIYGAGLTGPKTRKIDHFDPRKLVKVPPGSTLQTIKVLYGKK